MKERQAIIRFLTVIAVLLTLHVAIMSLPRSADAQYLATGPVEPVVVAGGLVPYAQETSGRAVRFWSDGAVDITILRFVQDECDIRLICGPLQILPGSCSADISRLPRPPQRTGGVGAVRMKRPGGFHENAASPPR